MGGFGPPILLFHRVVSALMVSPVYRTPRPHIGWYNTNMHLDDIGFKVDFSGKPEYLDYDATYPDEMEEPDPIVVRRADTPDDSTQSIDWQSDAATAIGTAENEGHKVKAVGSLLLDACDSRHAALLEGHIQHKGASLPVRFAELEPVRVEAICHQKPFAW
jgi:hypothetical protein